MKQLSTVVTVILFAVVASHSHNNTISIPLKNENWPGNCSLYCSPSEFEEYYHCSNKSSENCSTGSDQYSLFCDFNGNQSFHDICISNTTGLLNVTYACERNCSKTVSPEATTKTNLITSIATAITTTATTKMAATSTITTTTTTKTTAATNTTETPTLEEIKESIYNISNINITTMISFLNELDLLTNTSDGEDKEIRNLIEHLTQAVNSSLLEYDREYRFNTQNFEGVIVIVNTKNDYNRWTSTKGLSPKIPSSALQIAAKNDNKGNLTKLVFINYFDNVLFPSLVTGITNVMSIDIGFSIQRLSGLKESVQISYSNQSEEFKKYNMLKEAEAESDSIQGSKKNYFNATCVYWNNTIENWLSNGCELVEGFPLTCNCSHTTNFALILAPYLEIDIGLDIVSKIGFILSIFGLFLTLVIHLAYRTLRKRRSSVILMHICFNLCISYILFLVSEQAKNDIGLCIAMAFFLHVFFLASWTWMTVYSYDMYISLVKVFDNQKRFFLRKFGGLSYGLAVLIPVITLAVALPLERNEKGIFYLNKKRICWLDEYTTLIGFLTPVFIMFTFNLIVFSLVIKELAGKSQAECSAMKITAKQQLMVAITMVCFTGLAWIFAFLFIFSERLELNNTVSTVLNWLFVIFNVFQGFGIFLLTTVKRKETRRLWWQPIRSKLSDAFASFDLKSTSGARDIDLKNLNNVSESNSNNHNYKTK